MTDRHKPHKTVRVDPEVYDQLMQLAREDDRPLTRVLRRLVQEEAARRQGQGGNVAAAKPADDPPASIEAAAQPPQPAAPEGKPAPAKGKTRKRKEG